ncbi:THxN family PEP-CTERM protein [Sphingosinicella soli]|uniref:Ice-binding protein C-terminal domain-containing protein n=1 Tax=Sphingosinicella soli TaxID=333708 RepID=A0A7W7B281_9SPHN|nr:THxN family PEP-CTERM protein [Sphingosinicella soli]MBB4632634.1 hypothetical protein [Sphingosinicella soli]
MRKVLNKVLPAMTALATVGMATSAHAALVNTWSFEVTSVFSNSVFENNDGTPVITDERLEWGPVNGVKSAIGVTDTPTSGSLETNGLWSLADQYYHENNILPGGTNSLLSTDLAITISLTPADPAGATLDPAFERTFNISFIETPNKLPGQTCDAGGTHGDGINVNGCADIFVFAFDSGQFDFNYDGANYSLFLFEDPAAMPSTLGFLSDEACEVANVAPGCFGFMTAENATTFAQFVLQIEGVEVPEPAVLGLFGLGLVGLGFARRRKAA